MSCLLLARFVTGCYLTAYRALASPYHAGHWYANYYRTGIGSYWQDMTHVRTNLTPETPPLIIVYAWAYDMQNREFSFSTSLSIAI